MKKFIITLAVLFTLLLTACTNDVVIEFTEPVEGDFVETRDRYENIFDETEITNQWEGYGIGDPYVLRHNGVYYLYASTKNSNIGVRAWESSNLTDWTPVSNGVSEVGYVSEDEVTNTAYAPEVIYWDGMFYMYTSPGGGGHYILTSNSPVGPFVKATDNLGESIDGSVFIDNDEQMYFLRAHNSGIRMINMSDPLTFDTGKTLDNTTIGNWSEGPTMIYRDGVYYLTYTGTHVTSPGYRVNYSTATELGARDSFTMGTTNSLLLSTADEFNGLGHNGMVLGPNLDSYYMVYHNLNSAAGPNRSFNINRILFSGTEMVVNGAGVSNNIKPEMPDFVSTDGVENYTAGLSNDSASKDVSVEYNFIGGDAELLFGYVDESNYNYVTVNGNAIELHSVKSGTDTVETTGVLVNTFDFTKLHTVRVISNGSEVSVLFDGLMKIERAELETSAGKVGYKSVTEMNYSSFSNNSFGSSDTTEPVKNNVFASLYSKTGSHNLSVNELLDGSHEVVISPAGYAQYIIDVETTGLHSIFMNLSTANAGKSLLLQVDEGEPFYIELDDYNTDTEYLNTLVTEINIPKGVHTLKVIALDEELRLKELSFHVSSMSKPQFSNDLSNYIEAGAEYVTLWKLKDDGHHAIAGNRQLMYLGDETVQDVHLSIDMNFIGETASATAGILIKGSNVALSSHENMDSLVGYYIGFNNNRAFINKYNYNLSSYNVAISTVTRPESGTAFNVDIYVSGNTITVFVNDVEVMSYTDQNIIETGRLGLYTEGAEVIYSNLEITPE